MQKNQPCNNTWFMRLHLVVLCLLQTGPSSAAAVGCDIEPKCFPSRCNLNHVELIVDPGSIVTLNCSVVTGGAVDDILWTWKGETVKNASNSSSLVLQNVTHFGSGAYKCKCSSGNNVNESSITIEETSKPKKVSISSSPQLVDEGKRMELKCALSGRPIPRIVWLKDNQLIINGSEGFNVLEERLNSTTLRSLLRLSSAGLEHDRSRFTCNATNSHGWFKKVIELVIKCPGTITANTTFVRAVELSSPKLECLIQDRCDHEWHLNGTKLQSGNRYKITDEKVDDGKCKRRFTLKILNVTEEDNGDYMCGPRCFPSNTKATVTLKIYNKFSAVTTGSTAVSSDDGNGQRSLTVAFIVSAIGLVCLALLIFVFKWKTKVKRKKYEAVDDSRQDDSLFISYSSVDCHWVTNILIPLLQKNSINYRIHHRDFQLGRPIVQNMADSVYDSRKVLIVLSDNYLASNFCMEELSMALRRNADTVILVRIQQLKKRRLALALRKMKPLDYENLKERGNWEEKIVSKITGKNTSTV